MTGTPSTSTRLAGALTLLALFVVIPGAGTASETGLAGTDGHPRTRFPLTLHAASTGVASLDAVVARAVSDWNAVAEATLGVAAFRVVERESDAQVLITFADSTERLMGEARLTIEDHVIVPPVRVVVFTPAARGQTPKDLVLYQVVGHELGHALGLPHTRDPRSLMCCVQGSIDFSDARTREAYIDARRNPAVASSRAEIAEHYERFWKQPR
jgi:hypothetical protein